MKTYLPRLLQVLRTSCKYLRRYQTQILQHLPEGSEDAINAVLVACDALELIVELAMPPEV